MINGMKYWEAWCCGKMPVRLELTAYFCRNGNASQMFRPFYCISTFYLINLSNPTQMCGSDLCHYTTEAACKSILEKRFNFQTSEAVFRLPRTIHLLYSILYEISWLDGLTLARSAAPILLMWDQSTNMYDISRPISLDISRPILVD